MFGRYQVTFNSGDIQEIPSTLVVFLVTFNRLSLCVKCTSAVVCQGLMTSGILGSMKYQLILPLFQRELHFKTLFPCDSWGTDRVQAELLW